MGRRSVVRPRGLPLVVLVLLPGTSCAPRSTTPTPAEAPPPTSPPAVAQPEPASTPEPTPDPEPKAADEVAEAPPPPDPSQCSGLEVEGRWGGRELGDGWLPGLYASDKLPRGTVAITFDDGPHKHTPLILDELEKHEVPATFFVVGRGIKSFNYHLLQRMVAEGHTIGNHTYNHPIDIATQGGKDTHEFVQAQYEFTQMMVDVALLSKSPEEFKAETRVIKKGLSYAAPAAELVRRWPGIQKRYRAYMEAHGFAEGEHAYELVFLRGPGGNPFLGRWPRTARNAYAKAVLELGYINVQWHEGTHDSNPELPREVRYDQDRIVGTFRDVGRHGGIFVIHDRIPVEPFAAGLAALTGDPEVTVVPLAEVAAQKFGCSLESAILGLRGDEAPASSPP